MTVLQDRTALVTGGSRGIGRAVVQTLAAAGAKVAFVFRGSREAADSLVAEVTGSGGTALAVQGDVADPATAPRCVAEVLEKWGRLDILVNNAGVIRDGLFVRMDADAWNQVIQTNLNGTFHFCRAAVEPMVFKQRYGRIINVSSVAAEYVNAGQTNYSASKGAVNALTRALAVEVAGRNVTVNAIAPGFIETDMSEAVRNKAGDVIKKMIPMKRIGKPDDIAQVALFLAGPSAGYVTGQVITVDGGLSLGAVPA
ncbi:MAG TPA: 3-oxoacyl-ACP reductase family protein [Gemmataceae bacterium]|jgi:3-oxoacyl-[acyl-carrier protein] reductase|nr:3-oxoacyl-ACP reductase family protein [Gemmataceae bacterium]